MSLELPVLRSYVGCRQNVPFSSLHSRLASRPLDSCPRQTWSLDNLEPRGSGTAEAACRAARSSSSGRTTCSRSRRLTLPSSRRPTSCSPASPRSMQKRSLRLMERHARRRLRTASCQLEARTVTTSEGQRRAQTRATFCGRSPGSPRRPRPPGLELPPLPPLWRSRHRRRCSGTNSCSPPPGAGATPTSHGARSTTCRPCRSSASPRCSSTSACSSSARRTCDHSCYWGRAPRWAGPRRG